jgi:A/G-specific adenine glycosylase
VSFLAPACQTGQLMEPSAARRLLAWFDRRRRPLPWRRDRDPYRVWVSEIMLQQTRVETVAPYFERFVERFPDRAVLAAATDDEILAVWSGLGYYRRARQLLAAARQLEEAGAGWPRTAAEWRRLPGVGPYTAAAVVSIAFGEIEPALDGNAVRVLSRLAAESGDPRRAAVCRRLAAVARQLLDPQRPGDGNQALMELGATLCRPQRPRCELCPLAGDCRATAAGEAESYPFRRPAAASRRERRVVALVTAAGRLLMFRRPAADVQLAGLWELPWTVGEPGETAERDLGRRYGGCWRLGGRLAGVRHAITDRRIEAGLWTASRRDGKEVAEGPAAVWHEPTRLGELPTGSLDRKLLRAAGHVAEVRRSG